MHCHRMEGGVSSGSGGSSVDAFVDIGTLIVEGRIPTPESTRGFKEGPHCPVATTAQYATHNCDTNNSFLCQRAENLRKHMSLLCSNAVSMCVEVLLCPNCECGFQRVQNLEVANMPSSSDLLLEQWTVSVVHVIQSSKESCSMTVKDLFQAVRSQLHFSQLSAWWSSSKGKSPKHICYRITLPGEAFGSQFSKQPIMHSFPMAAINSNVCLKVSVGTLPRCESLPVLICPVHLDTNGSKDVETSVKKKSGGSEQPMLGECLLDLLGRRPPERTLSSSSCAINSKLDCDLGGTVQTTGTDSEDRKKLKVMCSWSNNLHSLTRKRHTRQQKGSKHDDNASLQLSPKETIPTCQIISGIVDDRMQTTCDLPGKHHCKCEDDTECLGLQDDLPRHRRRSQVTTPNLQSSSVSPASQNENLGSKQVSFNLTQKEVEDVLTVLRSRGQASNIQNTIRESNSETRWSKSTTKPQPSTSIMTYEDQKNKVPAKADLFLSAILRTNINTDQKCSLKRKFETDDENSGYEQFESSFPKNGCELNHTNCKKNLNKSSPENKNDGCDNNIQCLNSSVNKIDISSVTVLKDEFRTINSKEHAMCSNRFRTKQCDKTCSEEKPSITKNKLDVELLDKIQQLDLNKNNEACSSRGVPTALEKAKFRRSLDSAASMVFHWRTGLPLTSSPAPLRRASQRFDYDSSINSVSAISSALFDPVDSLSISSEDTESEGSAKSPSSPVLNHQNSLPWSFQYHPACSSLLGSFEESVLNGRLEPVSTVQGFTADLGASGSFCPSHLILPVTVFFYTLGDNDKVSTPYLAHINLGKKGYIVPRNGTIQVTLLNPLGTVIKMFVVVYDLTDMPVNSQTFLRQRTLYMPNNTTFPECTSQKYLRYLIHLRFSSSKSGRIYLHTDIRMIIFRKSDMDTATGHGVDSSYELRSFTHGPTNPKFSSRK